MTARLMIRDPAGLSDVGVLPTEGLRFSVEAGGGGDLTFTAQDADLDTLNAWDSVAVVELLDGATWTPVAAYALRPPFDRPKLGFGRVRCTGVALLEAWCDWDTVVLPEYTAGTLPRGAGTDRYAGWQMTAYSPEADTSEPWAGIYQSSRSTRPAESVETGAAWPSGSGAVWVSITGATDASERKMFRTKASSPLTITQAGPIRVHVASDSPGEFVIAGEPVLAVDGGEPGRDPIRYQQADMWMEPGEYACAFDTSSIWDTGGDGVDPVIVAICSLDADGDPDTWLLVSNTTDWVACRRNDEPPGEQPPGPTPGQLLAALVGEAQARGCSGWAGVTLGFTGAADSYGQPWPGIVVERLLRYASDTYWTVLRMLAETFEVDVWMGPDLVLHAAPEQGQTVAVTLDTGSVATGSDTRSGSGFTWAAGLALDGWSTVVTADPFRRERGFELGTAASQSVAVRILTAALADQNRWDGSLALAGTRPLLDYQAGDTLTAAYPDTPTNVRVLSISARAGEGDLLWDLEVTA